MALELRVGCRYVGVNTDETTRQAVADRLAEQVAAARVKVDDAVAAVAAIDAAVAHGGYDGTRPMIDAARVKVDDALAALGIITEERAAARPADPVLTPEQKAAAAERIKNIQLQDPLPKPRELTLEEFMRQLGQVASPAPSNLEDALRAAAQPKTLANDTLDRDRMRRVIDGLGVPPVGLPGAPVAGLKPPSTEGVAPSPCMTAALLIKKALGDSRQDKEQK